MERLFRRRERGAARRGRGMTPTERLDLRRWCEAAVSGIRYKPDRAKVYDELYAHLEDRCAGLIEAGVPEREAAEKALAAMGSAEEVAEMLERIHRPFWGWVLTFARVLLIVAAVLALFTVPRRLFSLGIASAPPGGVEGLYNLIAETNSSLRSERVFYAEPMARDSSDGYRFTLTRCAQWHTYGELDGAEIDSDEFYLTVESLYLRPWRQDREILRTFYAVDSLGNVYGAYDVTLYNGVSRALVGNPYRTGLCTVTWELWLSGFCSQGAEWIELRYDRAGRDVRLRVDLTGGSA